MAIVPLHVKDGAEIALSAGDHSLLLKAVVEEFATRFAPGSPLIYVGDTGDKYGYFEADLLATIGVTLNSHGKLPDVVILDQAKNWLFLIESVTATGRWTPNATPNLKNYSPTARPAGSTFQRFRTERFS